ncbi:hypothetical protein ACLOJK_022824 [Asimina triloba]
MRVAIGGSGMERTVAFRRWFGFQSLAALATPSVARCRRPPSEKALASSYGCQPGEDNGAPKSVHTQ